MLKPIVIEQGDDDSYVFPSIPDDVEKPSGFYKELG